MTTPTDTGERGGATSVQMALLWIAMITFIMAVVQTALLYLAGQLALTAAEDGLRSGRYYGVGSAEQARRNAQDFIARTAGTTLGAPTVEAVLSDDGATLQVTVSGTVLAVVPGLELHVAKQATGAIEQVTP
ncbi:pilus assembly protein [Pseudonocardia sp. KRD-184]|uniref:Pilus assembly protein n=1 Tax=Pseudonocardia oceani TaxID=2792013 RepID=A0ABS6U346_9PSEU|nr:TadE family protein [Pseudonocardia oceani]MBW0088751.1 pilus assembly protein [Pseudonocardia oceani]MBW0094659.1 pilus assembly protein [Pseudonocardia oceani]MBW0119819.1 pilus assembly protein [Pseudonocardia oceani]MBW0126666.1 pilus assembly protein [Pseudonocardia oceani]